jgi:hypothetical protein
MNSQLNFFTAFAFFVTEPVSNSRPLDMLVTRDWAGLQAQYLYPITLYDGLRHISPLSNFNLLFSRQGYRNWKDEGGMFYHLYLVSTNLNG